MKEQLTALLQQALARCQANGQLPADIAADIKLDHARDKAHGDFASNLAMTLAKAAGQKPRDLAQVIVAALPTSPIVAKVEIAGPGFINFYLRADAQFDIVSQILQGGAQYGRSQLGEGKWVQVEFVSANPTGPLHVGHGRGLLGLTDGILPGRRVEHEPPQRDRITSRTIKAKEKRSFFLSLMKCSGVVQ